jgi:hypothetical protein
METEMATRNGRSSFTKGCFIAGAAAALLAAGMARADDARAAGTTGGGSQVSAMHAAQVDVAKPDATAHAGAGAGEPSVVSPGTGTSPAAPRAGERAARAAIEDAKQVAEGNSGGRG